MLSAAAIISETGSCLALRQRSTTPPPRALVKSESKASEALRAVRAADARTRDAEARAADADHVAQEAKGDAERREELNQALRARARRPPTPRERGGSRRRAMARAAARAPGGASGGGAQSSGAGEQCARAAAE